MFVFKWNTGKGAIWGLLSPDVLLPLPLSSFPFLFPCFQTWPLLVTISSGFYCCKNAFLMAMTL